MCQTIETMAAVAAVAAWRPTAVGLCQCLGHGRAPCRSIRSSLETVDSLRLSLWQLRGAQLGPPSATSAPGSTPRGFLSGRAHRGIES